MLQLILGRAGTGKTEKIMKLAGKAAVNTEVIILVPDQICFDIEQRIVRDYSPEIVANIKALSFNRLCDLIFRTYGGISENRINEKGKAVLMALALEDCCDSLDLYQDAVKSGKMLKLMGEIVDEFKRCNINSGDLLTLHEEMGEEETQIKKKLYEVALVYRSYEARLSHVYIEPEDLMTRATIILRQNNFFKDKVVLIDSFESFNKQKLDILEIAISQCSKAYCSLCTEKIHDDEMGSIFSTISKTGRDLYALARENAVRVAPPIKLEVAHRFKNEDIQNFEKIYSGEEIEKRKDCDSITVYKADDIYNELEYVGATIRELVISGYNYSDIGIICRNSEKYSHLLTGVLTKYQVPAYISRPTQTGGTPLIRLVSSVFKIALFGYQTELVLALAKSGICGLGTEEISELENYVYLWKVDRADWRKEFTKSTGGFLGKNNEDKLNSLEQYRLKLIVPIDNFISKIKGATAKNICKNIYELLVNYNCEEYILDNTEKLENALMFEEATRQISIWEDFMDSLDQFASILGDKVMSVKDFWDLFGGVITKQEVQDIPLRLDCINFGSAENIKKQCKVIFLVGCVQDEFPKMPVVSGIFTANERKSLKDKSIILEKDSEEEMLLERFYAYSAVASASEKLFISYPSTDNGSDITPSEIVNKATEIIGAKIITELNPLYFANSQGSLFSAASKTYREHTEEAAVLKACVMDDNELLNRYNALERSVGDRDFVIDNKQISQTLFSATRLSPSGIDVYHRCKFRYFCRYGLYAKERDIAEVNVLEYGTVMHYIFEKFLSDGQDILEYDENGLEEKINKLILEYAQENMGGFEQLYVRDRYRLLRVGRTAKVIVKRLAEELKQSKFRPKYLEPELTAEGELPALKIEGDNGVFYVGGKIDRVDVYEGKDGTYVRVVDYKTGTKQFKLTDVLMGMNLQMLIYLAALAQTGLLPAGVLYMPSSYPEVPGLKTDSKEALMTKQSKKMCMNGLILDNSEIIMAMEKAVEGKYIPIKQKKDGEFAPDNLIEKEDFEEVFIYIKKLINTMVKELMSGNIDAKPLMVNMNSCSICPYTSVCLNESMEVEKIKSDNAEALDMITKSLKEGKGGERNA